MAASQVRRSKRQRVAVDYARLDESGFEDCARVQFRKLARAVMKWPQSDEMIGQVTEEPAAVPIVEPNHISEYVHSTGFQSPCVVKASEEATSTLGLRLPDNHLTVEDLAKLVGYDRQVETIDVSTQSEGPMYNMEEWVTYFTSSGTKKPLLNVVSLDLANTPLQKMVTAPSLVKELDLVEKAWPRNQSSTIPEVSIARAGSELSAPRDLQVQLYAIMSVSGCFMDFHLDFGGSSVWYHVISGKKTFLMIPPTKGNLMLFEEWSSSDKQASVFFADRASGGQKVELSAGDTLLLPGGWPHCVVTHADSIVIGGNFLTGYNLGVQLDVWQMEERLKVRQKFRFPFYKQLMWYTAARYLQLLNEDESKVTSWERNGLPRLVRCLNVWLQSKDGGEAPPDIPHPASLLVELKDRLEKCVSVEGGTTSPTEAQLTIKSDNEDEEGEGEEGLEDFHKDDDEDFDVEEDADAATEESEEEEFSESDDDSDGQPRRKPQPKSRVKKETKAAPRAPAPVAAAGRKKGNPKAPSTVRERLLKKIGIDPRMPMPHLKRRPKPKDETGAAV